MHLQLFDLTDRVAVVTGAGAGLGRAMARGLATFGAHVMILDVNEDAATETAVAIESLGRRAYATRCDVQDPAAIERAFCEVDRVFGRVDILVNNAGVGHHVRPDDVTPDEWRRLMDINVAGSFFCAQQAGRRMLEQHKGSIINISSIGGASALGRGNFVYDISKAAVNQLTRELAVEWAKHNIRVNAILPCQFRTGSFQSIFETPQFEADALLQRMLSGIPMNRLGEPDDLVGPVVFLASDASAMVTGTLLPVDGGNLALNAGGSHTW